MNIIEIYDPAMCCSTGLCGPSIDPELSRVAADLDQLKKNGITVRRYNLSQDAGAFVERKEVKNFLDDKGPDILPITLVNDKVIKTEKYPTRTELEALLGTLSEQNGENQSQLPENVRELIAIGAAIAANCEPCFRAHYKKAKDAGVSKEEMMEAVAVGSGVKNASANIILTLADRYLADKKSQKPENEDNESPCCGSESNDTGGSSCC